MMRKLITAAAVASILAAAPASANSLISPGPKAKIAKSSISAVPDSEWNRLSYRPGKKTEIWTLDGPDLNRVTFFGGIEVGDPILREADKKNQPLPRVTANMLITDIPTLLETTYRAQFRATQMTIDSQEPAIVGGHKGVRFTYSFARPEDEVRRKGEAVGAVVGDRLYMVTYEAPAIYFFEKDLARFHQLVSTLKF